MLDTFHTCHKICFNPFICIHITCKPLFMDGWNLMMENYLSHSLSMFCKSHCVSHKPVAELDYSTRNIQYVKNLSIIHIQSYSFLHAFRFNRTNEIVIFNYHATFNVYLSASRNGFIETNCMFAIFIIERDIKIKIVNEN